CARSGMIKVCSRCRHDSIRWIRPREEHEVATDSDTRRHGRFMGDARSNRVDSVSLPYEARDVFSAPTRRPGWVWGIVVLYALLLAGILLSPAILRIAGADADATMIAAGSVALLIGCGLTLIIVPVKRVRSRPVRR